jgi:hypothetical protein
MDIYINPDLSNLHIYLVSCMLNVALFYFFEAKKSGL